MHVGREEARAGRMRRRSFLGLCAAGLGAASCQTKAGLMRNSRRRVVIIGGGLGGCAAALSAASRGIDTMKSCRSGRNTENCPPPTDTATTPSGPPINASWAIPPLVVWKVPPTTSRIECRRPLASERVTRSPARRGPVPTPA